MTVATFSSPILYDKIAQEINTELNNMFDSMYGVAYTRFEGEETVPEIYKNDGSKVNFRVMPDKFRSLSFFTIEGEMNELDEDTFNIPMAFYVWVNLQKYDASKMYDYTAEIIRDVFNVLKDYGCDDMGVDLNQPFERFSMLQKQVDENTMRPYSAFRISFSKNMNICVI